jgi:GNAT superfamily N-acetyltransferase
VTTVNAPVIRDAVEADLPELAALMRQLEEGGTGYPPSDGDLTERQRQAFEEIDRNPNYRLLVVEDQGRVVGTTILMIVPNLSAGGRSRAIVENVVVDAGARGRRYGERLMAYCREQAEAAGCFKLQLASNNRRVDAHRFYERLGYAHTHHGYSLPLIDRPL